MPPLAKPLRTGLAAIALSLATLVPAHADSWQLLGQQHVGHQPDYDVFHVGRDVGRFSAVSFRALGNRVAIADVKIVYASGAFEHLNVQEHLVPGVTTRAYDLQGRHRRIDRIEVLYQNEGFRPRRHASVQVMGLKQDSQAHAPTPAPTPAPWPTPGDSAGYGWENLGTHPVSATVDHDTIQLGQARGRFRALKLQVHGRDIDLYNLRVTFADGSVQTVPVNGLIAAGMTTAPLDLEGRRRVIDRIDMVYRTVGQDWVHRTRHGGGYGHGEQARVTVFGLH